jgi:hypothetical protein
MSIPRFNNLFVFLHTLSIKRKPPVVCRSSRVFMRDFSCRAGVNAAHP